MRKLLTAVCVSLALQAPAQTLFHYGRDSVSATDFIQAYEAAHPPAARSGPALRTYFDLYLSSRLKVHEARARGYDTLPTLRADLQGLRQQLLPAHLQDAEAGDRLTKEAFERAQKDLRLAHIFISFTRDDRYDTADARRRAEAALQQLGSKPFAEVARAFSDDPAAAARGGELGWVTVFTLPYALENIAYPLPVGGQSGPMRSSAGYHLFKKLAERPARGRLRAAQILLAFPPGATTADKAALKKRADSLHRRLQAGDAFGRLAAAFSNDLFSASANGQLPEFGIGQYTPLFEETAFSLPRDGAYSKPFPTDFGYHIVQRLAHLPVPVQATEEVLQAFRARVEASDRQSALQSALAQKILAGPLFNAFSFDAAALRALTDSALDGALPPAPTGLTEATPLFRLGGRTHAVADWLAHARTFRYRADGTGIKPFAQVWAEYREAAALAHHAAHLEDFNPAFRRQLQAFEEGALFFEIMQRAVWEPAQADTAALERFYLINREKYNWDKSADAVLFYAADAGRAATFHQQLVQNPGSWRRLANAFGEGLAADSARFEWQELPLPAGTAPKAGQVTPLQEEPTEGAPAFAWIIRLYPQPGPRSFAEARHLVISDYQEQLDHAWVEDLRKKYPVQVNESLLDELSRKQ